MEKTSRDYLSKLDPKTRRFLETPIVPSETEELQAKNLRASIRLKKILTVVLIIWASCIALGLAVAGIMLLGGLFVVGKVAQTAPRLPKLAPASTEGFPVGNDPIVIRDPNGRHDPLVLPNPSQPILDETRRILQSPPYAKPTPQQRLALDPQEQRTRAMRPPTWTAKPTPQQRLHIQDPQ